jgi:Mrp family chromosome partitioning ATPase
MDSSIQMMEKPMGLLRRRASLIAWVVVLTVAAGLNAVWLSSDDEASPNYPLVVGLGLIGGLVLGVLLAYLWDRHSGRLRRVSDIQAATELPVLTAVPAMRLRGADRVAVTASQPVEGRQAYGMLAAGLAGTLRDPDRDCLLITSPTRGDGRTTTAVNLATLLAAEGMRVALVSADPNGMGADEMLGLDRKPGLAEVLDGSSSLDAALQPGGVERLSVLTAGGPSDQALSQSLDKLARVLDRLTNKVDLVVIDAPPVLRRLEASLLAQDIDLVLLVVDVRHGRRADLTAALAYLGHVRDRLVGCVANDPGPRRSRRQRPAAPAPPPVASPSASAPAASRSTPGGRVAAAGAGLVAAGAGLWALLQRAGGAAAGAARAVPRTAGRTARTTRDKLSGSAAPAGTLRRHRWAGVIAAVVAVALMISTVWWAGYNDDSSEAGHKPSAAQDASVAGVAEDGSSGRAAVAAAMNECRTTRKAQARPLHAAAASMNQWQVHVTAMNQLVAGKITLAQANQFWERTRVKAAQKVHRFHRANGTYQAGHHSCRTPDLARSSPGLAALTACQHNVAQRDDALQAARDAIHTWHHHVMDMNMLRDGTMSPARAIRLWNKYWKQGVAELHHYHKQLRQTHNQHC